MEDMPEMYCKCPYLTVQQILSGKWSLLILCYLRGGALRFGELRRCIEDVSGVTQATLTKALRKLEKDGLIVRKVYPEVPPRVEYSLSELGEELSPILERLGDFGARYIESRGRGEELCRDAYHTACRCYGHACEKAGQAENIPKIV